MSLLLPQSRSGTVLEVRPLDLHGDRYLDVRIALDGTDTAHMGRISALECPANLEPGQRVSVRFVMGVMTGLTRADASPPDA